MLKSPKQPLSHPRGESRWLSTLPTGKGGAGAEAHLAQAGPGELAHGVAGAGQAGQEQVGPRGGGQVAVQEVLHQPAAEEGRGAPELHPLHLEVHTWTGRREHTALADS